MTKRKNMTAGQRQAVLEKKVEQLEMTTRISQMLLQQLGQSSNALGRDLSELATRQREVQYRFLAVQELLDLKVADINAKAEALQIKDFEEASDKEDVEKKYTETDVVAEDSVVIVTTKAEEDAKSILRAKLVYSDIGFPQLKEDLLGKSVGDVVEADVNGAKHTLTVLGIRKRPEEELAEVEEVAQQEGGPLPSVGQNEQQVETNG